MIENITRIPHRVPRRTVIVQLVLPYETHQGAEIVICGSGPSYDHACADLEQRLCDWRGAFNFDASGEELT